MAKRKGLKSARNPTGRPVGRPLLRDQPLSRRIAIPVTQTMLKQVKRASEGHMTEWVRAIIERELASLPPEPEKPKKKNAT